MERNIVLIDNNFTIRELLKVSLRDLAKNSGEEFSLYTSQNGIEGLGFVYITQPEIVIIDTTLPKYSGNELLYFLLSNKKFHTDKVKIVILTEKRQQIRVPANFVVLDKSSKNFIPRLYEVVGETLKLNYENKPTPNSILSKSIRLANKLDILQMQFLKKNLLEKLMMLPRLLLLPLVTNILLILTLLRSGRVTDSNVKQEKRDLALLRRRHYPTVVGGAIVAVLGAIMLFSFVFSQRLFFKEVTEQSQAYGYGEVGWHSTMDSSSDVTNPVEGSQAEVLNGVDFVTDTFDLGEGENYEIKSARFDAANEVIRIIDPLPDDDFNLERGTVEFMYSPSSAHTANQEMTFFSIYADDNNKIEFKKLNDANDSLSLKYTCDDCTNSEMLINGADYSFDSGDWITFVVQWDAFAPSGEQMKIFLNGAELPSSQGASINPGSMPEITAIYIGNTSPSGASHANGKVDDFIIYLGVPLPSATPIGTPPPTPVYTQGSGQTSWYSTMNSVTAVTTPQVGDVPGNFAGASFVPGPAGFGAATYYDSAGKSIYIEGLPGIHYSLNEGAVEFYYKPDQPATHNAEINLFSIRQNDDGEIRFYKKDNAGANLLTLAYTCGLSCGGEETIALSEYQSYWQAGEWVFVRVTWNDNPALVEGEQLKIFLNGSQPAHTDQAEKIQGDNISTDPNPPVVYIGNRTEDGANSALGAIDEFKMYTTTLVPTPTFTLTPIVTLTPTITPTPSVIPTATPTPLWYSTLDSLSAINSPVYGPGGSVSGGISYVQGSPYVSTSETNKALSFFRSQNQASHILVNTSNDTVDETKGRITFYYQPTEGPISNRKQELFTLKVNATNRIRMYKDRNVPNHIVFEYDALTGGSTNYNRLSVSSDNYSWVAGDWVYFELNYDLSKPKDEQLRLFYSVQGGPLVEPIHSHDVDGNLTTPLGQVTKLMIGEDETSAFYFPRGNIDDFKLYGYYNPLPSATPVLFSPTPTNPQDMNILYYNTLANPTAVWDPVIGPSPASVNALSFVNDGDPEAREGVNIEANQSNIFTMVDGTVYSKEQGRIEFWYKPNFAYDGAPGELSLFWLRGAPVIDRIELNRAPGSDYNLEFIYYARCVTGGDVSCNSHSSAEYDRTLSVPKENYQNYWVQGKWMKFEAVWDNSEENEEDKLKLFITHHDGSSWQMVELSGTHTGVLHPEAMADLNRLTIGNSNPDPNAGNRARGALSEFKIWGLGSGITPTPSPSPVPLTAADPIWYSTLDDANAITTPVIGKGATSSNVTYEAGVNGNAVKIDANSEHVAVEGLPETDFKKDKGAIEFYYKPDVPASVDQAIHLFNIENNSSHRMRLYKTNSTSSPLYLSYTHSGTTRSISIPYASFAPFWEIGKWTLFRVEWDRTKSAPNDLKIFLNNERPEVTPAGSVFSDFSGTANLYIGNTSSSGTEPARGSIDDFAIFGNPDSRVFTVNSTDDTEDSNIGDSVCKTANGDCTLRAAIQEANDSDAPDTIRFGISGSGPHVINVSSDLPTINKQLHIDATTQGGVDCSTSDLRIALAKANFTGNGLNFSGVSNNQVKGLVIYGFNRGISANNSSDNTFTCNIIGLDTDGDTVRGNSGYGIYLENNSDGNNIGGVGSADRNIISSSTKGIGLKDSDNSVIRGNYIGTNKTGTATKGNEVGIEIQGSANTTIGDASASSIPSDCSGTCNLISGNSIAGIFFVSPTTSASDNNTIKGNFLGTNQVGSEVIANRDGIRLYKSSGNTISYNLFVFSNIGVNTYAQLGSNLSDLEIQGNYFGLNRDADSVISNSVYGINIYAANGASISGADITANIIAGSTSGAGIYAYGKLLSDIEIKSNYIGTNQTSQSLSNKYGIHSLNLDQANSIVIGGDDPSDGNIIGFNSQFGIYLSQTSNTLIKNNEVISNSGDGVSIQSPSSVNNTVIENSIYQNDRLGINLSNDGVTYNDQGDSDIGPNNLQNYPVIVKALYDGSELTLYGGFQSELSKYYRLDFYSNSGQDESGFGEGENHFHTITGVSGSLYDFNTSPLVLNTSLPEGHRYISATATECGEEACTTLLSTSEFGFTGFDGDFHGKDIHIDKYTGNLDTLYVTGDGEDNITDVFSYNIKPDGSLGIKKSFNIPGMSAIGSVSLDNEHFGVSGVSETNQYRVYRLNHGQVCAYNLGTNAKVTDIALERNGVGSKYIYLSSNVSGKQFSVIQGMEVGESSAKYGEYLSEVRDMGASVPNYHSLTWSQDLGEDGGKIRLQIRSGNSYDLTGQEWYGPDGTRGSFYELDGQTGGDIIPKVVQGKQFLQYRLLLEADSQLMSPSLESITIRYGN